MIRNILIFGLILVAALSRLLPHPMNFTPIAAIALFGGVYLDKKHTFVVPLIAMLASDYVLGFYQGMAWTYACFLAIGLLGLWLRGHRTLLATVGATLTSSILFFVVTNFGVWASAQVSYPPTLVGLGQCYIAAIPFFRNTLAGDMFYVTALFGLYEVARKAIPQLATQSAK